MDKILYVGFNVNISEGTIPGNNTIGNNISIEVFNFLSYLKSKYGAAGNGITDINGISINIVPNMCYNNGGK